MPGAGTSGGDSLSHAGGKHPPVRKSLGQHFLSDPRILARIADAVMLKEGETVIEIGPGRGALTAQLAARAGRVIAIEIDAALAAALRVRFAGDSRVTVIERDALRVNLAEAAAADFALVGNIPYYITTPIVFHALERPRPSRAVFLVQLEVAERMSAMPGTRQFGALSVNVQGFATCETLFRVAPGSFQPPPSVYSAVVRITPLSNPVVPPHLEEGFRAFVISAFGMRRKQISRVWRNLRDVDAAEAIATMHACGIDPTARPETLTPEQFARLAALASGPIMNH
ncbi:MAG: 16S rRNA (adenine(1518)-N(6)/adenine(1519)-N(6))-dimethyltransferase RsmA [Gemmatimonadaceae bacterium]